MDDRAIDPGVRATAAVWTGIGVLVAVTPFVARPVGFVVATSSTVEIVDHVLPGLLVVLLAGGLVVRPRFAFELALAATLAGLWATSTHVPLVLDAGRGAIGWPTAAWHTIPATVLLLVGVWSAVRAGRADPDVRDGDA